MSRRAPRIAQDCHAIGHAWYPIDTHSDYKPPWGTPMWLKCERCDTERRELLDINGRVGSRTYVYPDGYQYAKGQRPTRNDERLSLLARHNLVDVRPQMTVVKGGRR